MNDRKHLIWWVLFGAALIGLLAAGAHLAWKNREAQIEADRAAAQQAEEAERLARMEVARLFGEPRSPTPDDLAAFSTFFDSLGAALQSNKPATVAAYFDSERMAEELAHRGFFARFGTEDADRARATFTNGIERVGRLVVEDTLYRWNHTAIRRVSWNADRSSALIVATHRLDGRPDPLRMRWWLVATPRGWKAYDLENMVGGVSLLSMLEAATDSRELKRFQDWSVEIRGAMSAALAGYPDTADQLIGPLRGSKLPDVLAAPATLVEAFIRIHRGDPAGALARLEAASKQNGDLPLLNLGRAIACARSGDYPAAGRAVAFFAIAYGDDLGIRFWQAFALEEQSESEKAAHFYGMALDDDPNSLLALNGLRRTTRKPDELVKRIGAHRNTVAAYAFLKRASEAEGIPFIASQWPDRNELAGFDLLREAARFQRVEEMYRAKQGIVAYQKIGPDERTATQLAGAYVRDNDANGLARLLVMHGEAFPNDPMSDQWFGEYHTLKQEFPKAAARYRSFSRNPAASPADRYSASILQVRNWLRAGDAVQATQAVNEIGPEWLPAGVRAAVLAQAGDVAGVERMMSTQAKSLHGLAPLYADEDFARLIAGEKFAGLQKKYPRP